MPPVVIHRTNRSPSLSDTIRVNGAPEDLTGLNVDLNMRPIGSTTLTVNGATANVVGASTTLAGAQTLPASQLNVASTSGFLPSGAVLVDGAQVVEYDGVAAGAFLNCRAGSGAFANGDAVAQIGGVSYDWQITDVATAGMYKAWWDVDLGAGKVQDTPEFLVWIVDHAPALLCDLAHVREHLQKPDDDVDQDGIIWQLIEAAGELIAVETGRQYAPVSAATYRFEVNPMARTREGVRVDLYPRDLRAATTVTLHPETSSPTVLTSAQYRLRPVEQPLGVYSSVYLAPTLAFQSDGMREFGSCLLDILGDWGFATVPAPVRQACVLAVHTWMRLDIQSISTTVDTESGLVTRPRALPAAAWDMLRGWRRPGVA